MFSAAGAGKPTERLSNRLDLASWWQLLTQVRERIERNHVSMMSAGVAFYALFSVFPALSALISIYGLFADRSDVQRELESLARHLACRGSEAVGGPDEFAGSDPTGKARHQSIGCPVERNERHDRFDAGAHRGLS
jgi:hypothetical protein